MTDRYLSIYLRDHLAMGQGGIDLVRRMATANADNELGDLLDQFGKELQEEASDLKRALKLLDIEPSQLKKAGVWFAEKIGRLKLNGELRGYSPLSRLLELEGLMAAVQARKGLWMTLLDAKHMYPKLEQIPLQQYFERADKQLEELDEMHIKAARHMLKTGWKRDEDQRRPPAR